MTILIADDLETNRKLARASLKTHGYNLVEVADGQEALQVLETATIPMVGLIDWEMPGMDGLEVCRRARQRVDGPPLFLILLTIRDSQKDIVAGLESGANDYITKPFDYAELVARVRVGVEMLLLQQKLIDQAQDLRDALTQIKVLSGILPICSYCNKIRDEENKWERVDTYVTRHSEANFSHGICPDCYQVHMLPQLEALKSTSESPGPAS